jgi:hypothetical protein
MKFQEFVPLFKQLCTFYGRSPVPIAFEAYYESLRGLSTAQFEAAAKSAIATSPFLPTAEALVGLCGKSLEQEALAQWQAALAAASSRTRLRDSGLDDAAARAIKLLVPEGNLSLLGQFDSHQVSKWADQFARLYIGERRQMLAAAALPSAQQGAIAGEVDNAHP